MEIVTHKLPKHGTAYPRIDADHQADKMPYCGKLNLLANPHSCRSLNEAACQRAIKAGETLFWEGDTTQYVHYLRKGSIKAYKLLPNGRSQIIRFITLTRNQN